MYISIGKAYFALTFQIKKKQNEGIVLPVPQEIVLRFVLQRWSDASISLKMSTP